MQIIKLTIDEKDMLEAVQAFLKTRGIAVPVHSVSKQYLWEKEYEVTFEFEVQAAPAGKPEPIPAPEPLPVLEDKVVAS